jgi:dTMP kinase
MAIELGQHGAPMLASASGMPTRGRLITIEGLDGAGKTTVAKALEQALRDRGIDAAVLREPGGVPAAERIRELVKDPAAQIGHRAEALLYAAARAQLVEEALEPLLTAGTWVILDRFVDSSLAYQGAGRELGIEPVKDVNEFATGGLKPDRTLLLTVDPALGFTRARERGEAPDRLELERGEFFDRIASAYAELAAADPARIRPIDATQPPEAVLSGALAAIDDLL